MEKTETAIPTLQQRMGALGIPGDHALEAVAKAVLPLRTRLIQAAFGREDSVLSALIERIAECGAWHQIEDELGYYEWRFEGRWGNFTPLMRVLVGRPDFSRALKLYQNLKLRTEGKKRNVADEARLNPLNAV